MAHMTDQGRRDFLTKGLLGTATLLTTPALAYPTLPHEAKTLSFHNLHTDEKAHLTYFEHGRYNREALQSINHLLRDHYTNDVYPIDVRVLDLLHLLQRRSESYQPIEVLSGYRSPTTNNILASLSDGVAKHSYHLKGMALDFRFQDRSLSKLYKLACSLKKGGVGYYPDSEFVHIDVGPVRTWS